MCTERWNSKLADEDEYDDGVVCENSNPALLVLSSLLGIRSGHDLPSSFTEYHLFAGKSSMALIGLAMSAFIGQNVKARTDRMKAKPRTQAKHSAKPEPCTQVIKAQS